MVASLSDILSLVRTAVLTEKPRSATAFPCEIVREAFAKRERCGNILQPVTSVKRNRKSVKFNKLLRLVGRKMVFKDFKDKIRFLRTFKDRANFFRNLRTSGRPVNAQF